MKRTFLLLVLLIAAAAGVPLKLTEADDAKLVTEIATAVPTGPVFGARLVIVGGTGSPSRVFAFVPQG